MNVTLPATELKKLVKKLSAVQSENISLGNGFALATDGDIGVSVVYPFLDAPISVNSRLFSTTCNKLTKDVVLISDKSLVIKSNKFKAELPIDFSPVVPPPVSSLSELEIESTELSKLLTFAGQVTNEKVTYDHTGSIQFSADSLGVVVQATDNLRVAVITDKVKYPNFDPILIPTKVIRVIKELEGMVSISQTDSAIFFQAGDTTIYTRKSTKKFPDIGKVISKSYKLIAEINIQELTEVLNRVSPTIDPDTDSKVLLSFQNDVLKLQSGNQLIGQIEDELQINPIFPDAFEEPYHVAIGVNARFLNQFLTNVKECGTILFKCNESGKPFFMQTGNKSILMAGIKI